MSPIKAFQFTAKTSSETPNPLTFVNPTKTIYFQTPEHRKTSTYLPPNHSCSCSASNNTYTGKPIDLSLAYQKTSIPSADPVSIAIAYHPNNHGYSVRIKEDKLNYGFRQMPVNEAVVKPEISKSVLPEENLHQLNGPVMELVRPSVAEQHEDLAEEAEEELMNVDGSDEAVETGWVVKKPSLVDLGYGPATASPGKFVEYPGFRAENQGCILT
ncbi:uncharacterized protein LOC126743188 isoform X2 [Anthonomus grandis grandis]|uniref:uncharacterized protein LOC126743188 isoform X2 n=1 Tax=Anthonomus grandis grandis TaxID=2921223 RepID=UPI002165F35D|nr:uncharacterized protein LOC126743188 isoform X2 [Anthonomus grandis grandis]